MSEQMIVRESIVVCDANIFIDLCTVDLLEAFFSMSWTVHTTDMVLSEINAPEQKQKIDPFKPQMVVKEFQPDEIIELLRLQQSTKARLSIQDCSLLYYCSQNGFTMITGDRCLRSKAEERNIVVRGVLYVFDRLVDASVISSTIAADRLERLNSINQRLPQKEIELRLTEWKKK